MKYTIGVTSLIIVGIFGWFIGSRLSADAIGMAVGVLFGILAGIPAALMMLASSRQSDRGDGPHGRQRGRQQRGQLAQQMPYASQPPVIILAGNPAQHQLGQPIGGHGAGGYGTSGYGSMPQQPQNQYFDMGPAANNPPVDRQFRVVGEHDESIDTW